MKTLVQHPEWTKNAVIYEVNTRQYTDEGTFKAFRDHLPRLKNLGVDILWFMPIYPIGVQRRKGSLGSYYSISNYRDINPEFGTLNEFKELVKEIHGQGMYVILDWVANHTSWDNNLITSHPEWYHQNKEGHILPPFDWEDVAHLDYTSRELWEYMAESMLFWIENANIDGFRCDVADLVPDNFWNYAREFLDQHKPVFMLAEAERAELNYEAFDMSYASSFHKLINSVAQGKKQAYHFIQGLEDIKNKYPEGTYLMQFITNHDENSWNGSEFERLGRYVKASAVLTFTAPGMPLIYSGQEAGYEFRLKFFDKDHIMWQDCSLFEYYQRLIELKKENKALWNGEWGGSLRWINTTQDEHVFAFIREKSNNKVFVALNFSESVQKTILKEDKHKGSYIEYFTNEKRNFDGFDSLILKPHEALVYVGKE